MGSEKQLSGLIPDEKFACQQKIQKRNLKKINQNANKAPKNPSQEQHY